MANCSSGMQVARILRQLNNCELLSCKLRDSKFWLTPRIKLGNAGNYATGGGSDHLESCWQYFRARNNALHYVRLRTLLADKRLLTKPNQPNPTGLVLLHMQLIIVQHRLPHPAGAINEAP